MPTLVIADLEQTPDSRIDAQLLKTDSDTFTVWLYAPGLELYSHNEDRFLFNFSPPYGDLPINLGQLDWNREYSGITVFEILPPAFGLHFGGPLELRVAPLAPGQTLLTALQSVGPNGPDLPVLSAIAALACPNVQLVLAGESLRSVLSKIVVPVTSSTKSTKRPTGTRELDDKLGTSRRQSIWTPGASESDFMGFYSQLVGNENASRMWDISRRSISAVAAGDFSDQVSIATELASFVPEGGVLAGEAAYFKAEGLRLLADIDRAPAHRDELRNQAVEHYTLASALLPNDPRPVRGLGRITELKGDFGEALKQFTLAKGLCWAEMSRDSRVSELDLAHEILRSSRHFIHCLLDIRDDSSFGQWHQNRKERELEGHLQECENLHMEHMPSFQTGSHWYYIEWFMGLVFLAKAWGSLGRYNKMQLTLVKALDARRRILTSNATLSTVESANLEWWLSVAMKWIGKCDQGFAKSVELLETALRARQVPAVNFAIQEIVSLYLPPWTTAVAVRKDLAT